MKDTYFTLKEVELNNHCPECYSNTGLELTFKQRFAENVFYKAITKDTSHSLFCKVCKTAIFPARWDDDIDRVFEYQQRATPPRESSFKLKSLSWILIVVFSLLLIGVTLLFLGIFNS